MRAALAFATAAASIALAGCATINPEYALANADPGHSTAVTCDGASDCAAKLARARAWAAANSPGGDAPTIAVNEVDFAGAHVLDFRATCHTAPGCRGALADLRVRFEDAMRTPTDGSAL